MRKQLLLVCPLLLAATAMWAAPLPCTSTSLSVYDASGFSCTQAGLLFSSFSYLPTSGLPLDSQVQVVPTNDPVNVGFNFIGAFQSGAGTSSDALLSYRISAATAVIAGSTVSLVSSGASGGGNVQIVEGICTTAPVAGACLPPSNSYSLDAYYNSGPPVSQRQTDSITFVAPSAVVYVSKNIITNGANGSAAISSFSNTVQVPGGAGPGGGPVPEPASLITLGTAVIFGSIMLRKRAKRV